jgi:predicted Zn finger-like uncharacterized protein
MKIACQSCQAKYTIADEKVLGRVVKIRCKKCGATIVINGNEVSEAGAQPPPLEDTAQANAAPGYDYAAQQAGEQWTVNVADGDQRTMTAAEIVSQFRAGVVNDETYCWKDGMADWLPVREIDSLAASCGIAAGAPPEAPPEPQAAAGMGGLFGGGGTPYPSPMAASAEANGGGGLFGGTAAAPAPAARRAGRAAGADLFGAAAEAGGENDVMTSAPQGAPAMHEDGKLTGQRNENSVLFSLTALTQNAPKDEGPAPPGDGSGLIDLRALASTMAPNNESQRNHVDDIMNLGGGGAFSAALAAPVLAPPLETDTGLGGYPSQQAGNRKLMIALIAVGMVAIGLMVVIFLALKPKPETAMPGTEGTASTGAGAGAVANNPTASAPAATDSTPPPTATTAAPPDTAVAAAKPATAGRHGGGGNWSGASAPQGDNTPKANVPPPSQPPAGFESAIKQAAGDNGSGPSQAAATPASTAPFDRGAAAAALGAINVASCKRADGPTGGGHVAVTFAPSGGVVSAVVDQPPFAGTVVGGCVAGKFRGARVPAFGGGNIKVGKSFAIN